MGGQLPRGSAPRSEGNVEIAGSAFLPSKILYMLDATQYEATRLEWEAEQASDLADREAAA